MFFLAKNNTRFLLHFWRRMKDTIQHFSLFLAGLFAWFHKLIFKIVISWTFLFIRYTELHQIMHVELWVKIFHSQCEYLHCVFKDRRASYAGFITEVWRMKHCYLRQNVKNKQTGMKICHPAAFITTSRGKWSALDAAQYIALWAVHPMSMNCDKCFETNVKQIHSFLTTWIFS